MITQFFQVEKRYFDHSVTEINQKSRASIRLAYAVPYTKAPAPGSPEALLLKRVPFVFAAPGQPALIRNPLKRNLPPGTPEKEGLFRWAVRYLTAIKRITACDCPVSEGGDCPVLCLLLQDDLSVNHRYYGRVNGHFTPVSGRPRARLLRAADDPDLAG